MRPSLANYRKIAAGKVRELYEIDDNTLLMVASDRLSAFDFVLSTPIKDKGRILTAMSVYFFAALEQAHTSERPLVGNHIIGSPTDERIPREVVGRALVVKKLSMLPVECVVRGYLSGSGLSDYLRTGSVCGIELPAGLTEASKLPVPIFTPTTKAEVGDHDEAIDFAAVIDAVGQERAEELRTQALTIYGAAAELALTKGIILADTKFEFGVDATGNLVLADEVLTPDSSRYWDAAAYSPGAVQPSFDKQIVRNWLTSSDAQWDKTGGALPPELPAAVVEKTRQRYIEAYERISGLSFAQWPSPETVTD